MCEDLSRFLVLPDTLACKYTVYIFSEWSRFTHTPTESTP